MNFLALQITVIIILALCENYLEQFLLAWDLAVTHNLMVPYRLVMRYFVEHGEFPSERVLLATLAAYHAQPELFSDVIELPTIIGTVKFNQLLELPEEGEASERHSGQDLVVIEPGPPVPKKPKAAPKVAPKPPPKLGRGIGG